MLDSVPASRRLATLRRQYIAYGLVVALLLVLPLFLSDFRLALVGKYLAFAVAAVGLDLLWGYAGVLSLGHAVFFSLGAYSMAMHMKLQSEALPDFMVWSGLEQLPWFWEPFRHFAFALPMAVVIPATFAIIIGYPTFRSGIRGVYFSILTQAMALAMSILLIGQQPFTGGTNGITNFQSLAGISLYKSGMRLGLYLATVATLVAVVALARWLVNTRTGTVLMAIRDGENRLRFLGYNPVRYKVVTFALSAGIAGFAGALFVPQVGIISPSSMSILPSVEMGDLGGGRRARHDRRGGGRRGSGELGQDRVQRVAAGGVAVRVRGAIHRRGAAVPARAGRHRGPGTRAAAGGARVQAVRGAGAPDRGRRGGQPCCPAGSDAGAGGAGVLMIHDILYVESVTVEFDGFRALEQVNLIVRKGELRFLIGPNGAGKTTLLDVICGKVKPVEGRVQFANEIDLLAHDQDAIARLGISRKFQAPSVFDSLTVQQNMALAAEVPSGFLAATFQREGRAARRRIDEVLDMVGLAERRDGVAGTLAHGEKQWLELGMAIVQDPELLLVDEPVAGMTAGERERTGELLEAIARERSVVVVEHDMQFVSRFSSLVTVLHAGRVICEGDFATIKKDPTVIDVYLGREPGGGDEPGGGNAA